MIMKTPTKVWPLKPGVPGYTAQGAPITLQPGMPGWMSAEDARKAEDEGKVDIMVGKTPQTLRKPCYETRVTKPAFVIESEPEPDAEPQATPEPPPVAKPKPRPARSGPKRQYRRTDLKAET